MSCCALDMSENRCVAAPEVNEDKCAKLFECCSGMHDAGLQAQCLSKVRECRKLGNVWDIARPLRPMNAHSIFTSRPGYTTQGNLLEKFAGGSFSGLTFECIAKTTLFFAIIGCIFKTVLKTDVKYERILLLSVAAALIRCMVECLN